MTSRLSSLGCPPRHSTPATDRPSFGSAVVATARALGWDAMPHQRLMAQVGLEHEGGQLVLQGRGRVMPAAAGQIEFRAVALHSTDAGGARAVVRLRRTIPSGGPAAAHLGVVAADPPVAAAGPVHAVEGHRLGDIDRGERVAADPAEHRREQPPTATSSTWASSTRPGRWMRPPSRRCGQAC